VLSYSEHPDVRNYNWGLLDPVLEQITNNSVIIDSFLLIRRDGAYYRTDNDGNPAQGGIVTANNRDPAAKPNVLTDRDYFIRTVSNNSGNARLLYVADPNLSKSTGLKQIVIAASIPGRGAPLGAFAATIGAKAIESLLDSVTIETSNKMGHNAKIAIVSETGALVSFRYNDVQDGRFKEHAFSREEELTTEVLPGDFRAAYESLLSDKVDVIGYATWKVIKTGTSLPSQCRERTTK
jgi:hypothetical protein